MSLTSSVRNAFFVNVFVRLPLPSRCTEGHLRLVPQANMQSASWKHTLLTRASGNTTASEWCLTHVTEGLFTSFHIGDSLVPYLWSLTQSIRTYLSASQITAEPFHAWSVEGFFGKDYLQAICMSSSDFDDKQQNLSNIIVTMWSSAMQDASSGLPGRQR